MSTYQEFKNKWLGKGIDYDGAYGFQCFDVINQYILEITGQKPYIRLDWADEIFKRPNDIIPAGVPYTKITNNETPNNFPIQGDIIVWDKAKWNGFGGHTGVVDSANANDGTVLQQNGLSQLQPCQLVNWNFFNATPLGWIRLQQQPPTPQPNPEFKEVYPDEGSGLWSLCKKAGYPVIPTNQPNHEPTNSICYNRIPELNGTNRVIYGQAYKVDFDPVAWFNSKTAKPVQVDSIIVKDPATNYTVDFSIPVQPQPEAITTPAQPNMPTITIEEPTKPLQPNLEDTLTIDELRKEVALLRAEKVQLMKANQLANDLDLNEVKKDSFSFLQAFKGAEKVGGITATIILILGYLLANVSQLNGVISPQLIAQSTSVLSVLVLIAKSIYSTSKK